MYRTIAVLVLVAMAVGGSRAVRRSARGSGSRTGTHDRASSRRCSTRSRRRKDQDPG